MNIVSIFSKLGGLVTALKPVFTKGHKSKTVWVGAALAVVGFAQAIFPEVAALLGPHAALASAGIGAAMIVLRALTDTPLEDK